MADNINSILNQISIYYQYKLTLKRLLLNDVKCNDKVPQGLINI